MRERNMYTIGECLSVYLLSWLHWSEVSYVTLLIEVPNDVNSAVCFFSIRSFY